MLWPQDSFMIFLASQCCLGKFCEWILLCFCSLETFAAKHQAPELIPQSLIDELRQIMFIARQKQQTSAVQANNSNADNAAPNGVASNTEQEGSGDVEMADATKVEEGVPLETVADGEDAKPEVANEEAAIIDPASITEQEIKAYWLSQLESVYEVRSFNSLWSIITNSQDHDRHLLMWVKHDFVSKPHLLQDAFNLLSSMHLSSSDIGCEVRHISIGKTVPRARVYNIEEYHSKKWCTQGYSLKSLSAELKNCQICCDSQTFGVTHTALRNYRSSDWLLLSCSIGRSHHGILSM